MKNTTLTAPLIKNEGDENSLLSTKSLSFAYDTHTQFSNINLTCQAGEFIGLIGANGAGKSTLLKLLLGLLSAQSGDVHINNQALKHLKRRDIAKKMAFVPQSIELPFAFTVEEVVMMGRNPYLGPFQLASWHDKNVVQQALQTTDVTHLQHRKVNQLSGGEKQRVIIARALAQESQCILLDEPIASLDICHQFETLDLIQSLTQQGKLAITAIHDLNLAARYCSRLILLGKEVQGKIAIVGDGSPEQVLTPKNLRDCFNIEADIVPNFADKEHEDKTDKNALLQQIQLTNIKPIKRFK